MRLDKIMIVLSVSLVCGCIVMRDISTDWYSQNLAISEEAPGSDEYTALSWTHELKKVDSGRRTAYGILPGGAQGLWGEGSAYPFTGDSRSINILGWSLLIPLSNLGSFGCSSLAGVCAISEPPFNESLELRKHSPFNTVWALIGRHDWENDTKSEDVLDSVIEKRIYAKERNAQVDDDRYANLIIGKTSNGIPLYFNFPGMDVIEAITATNGSVAVMFEHGPSMMRVFSSPKFANLGGELATPGIVYEDFSEDSDSYALMQISHQRNIRAIRNKIETLFSSSEYKDATEGTQEQFQNLKDSVYNELNNTQPSCDGVYSDLNLQFDVVKDAVSYDNKVAMKARREHEIARMEELEDKMEQLKSQEELDDIIKACDEEIDRVSKSPSQMAGILDEWNDIRKNAVRKAELARIETVQQTINKHIAIGEWSKARDIVNKELTFENPMRAPEDRKVWEECLERINVRETEVRKQVVKYLDSNATRLSDGRLMSKDPRSTYYRGPKGDGLTNAEAKEKIRVLRIKALRVIEEARQTQKKVTEEIEGRGGFIGNAYYHGGRLISLNIAYLDHTGTLEAGFSGDSFRYPYWMSSDDAQMIWSSFAVDVEGESQKWQDADFSAFRIWREDGTASDDEFAKMLLPKGQTYAADQVVNVINANANKKVKWFVNHATHGRVRVEMEIQKYMLKHPGHSVSELGPNDFTMIYLEMIDKGVIKIRGGCSCAECGAMFKE